jgi:hypothetical protein
MAAPFPRLIPAHFASPGLCFAKPLSGLAKRRKQPERYMTWGLNWSKNKKITRKNLDKIKIVKYNVFIYVFWRKIW